MSFNVQLDSGSYKTLLVTLMMTRTATQTPALTLSSLPCDDRRLFYFFESTARTTTKIERTGTHYETK